jgi:hypothetical protein
VKRLEQPSTLQANFGATGEMRSGNRRVDTSRPVIWVLLGGVTEVTDGVNHASGVRVADEVNSLLGQWHEE